MTKPKVFGALLQGSLDDLLKGDFLGAAATAGHDAAQAIRERRYDDAWRLLHEQKSFYLKQAQRFSFTARQTLALDGTVHEQLANILRLQSKHDDALVNLLYCIATNDRASKSLRGKVPAYFTRCQFKSVAPEEVERILTDAARAPDFRTLRAAVAEWRTRS